jgi:4'-phosphopantetheinyl transferase
MSRLPWPPPWPAADELHLWRFPIGGALRPGDLALLSADERDRRARLRLTAEQDRFCAARSGMRRILAAYLGREPATLRFVDSGIGKPELDDAALRFNLSHAAACAVLAVTGGRPVGVDIEDAAPGQDLAGVAETIMAASEFDTWTALPHAERPLAFLRAWTRKEAVVKALGTGLYVDPRQVVTHVAARRASPSPVMLPRDVAPQDEVTMRDLPLRAPFAGAVACCGPLPPRLRHGVLPEG